MNELPLPSLPFLTDFCAQVKQIYESAPPGKVCFRSDQLDSEHNWLYFQFEIVHARKLDEIGIRWSGNEITVDFLPGGSTTNTLCFKDNYGLRWVFLDCSRACLNPNKAEKDDIERIVNDVHATSQHYKSYLRFLIGHSWEIKTTGVKK